MYSFPPIGGFHADIPWIFLPPPDISTKKKRKEKIQIWGEIRPVSRAYAFDEYPKLLKNDQNTCFQPQEFTQKEIKSI